MLPCDINLEIRCVVNIGRKLEEQDFVASTIINATIGLIDREPMQPHATKPRDATPKTASPPQQRAARVHQKDQHT
jgi:hypothetical protein